MIFHYAIASHIYALSSPLKRCLLLLCLPTSIINFSSDIPDCLMMNINIPDGDIPGKSDIKGSRMKSWRDCRDRCEINSDCKWFTFHKTTKGCWLKYANGKGKAKENYDFISGRPCCGDSTKTAVKCADTSRTGIFHKSTYAQYAQSKFVQRALRILFRHRQDKSIYQTF